MSLAEVFEEVKSWTADERQQLALRLKMIELANDPAYMAEIQRRIDDAEAGKNCVSSQEYRALMAERLSKVR